jgi:hypothetical protein
LLEKRCTYNAPNVIFEMLVVLLLMGQMYIQCIKPNVIGEMYNVGHVTGEMYNMMYYCWDKDPTERPSFSQLVKVMH